MDRVTAAVGLGSNLGDRRAHLDYAASKLHRLLAGLKVSRYYDTKPVGTSGPQPMFLNAAAVGRTELSARSLLDALLAIEELGGVVPVDVSGTERRADGNGAGAARAVIAEDARDAQAFVDRWRVRIAAMPNARHARMVDVILGEVLEAKRFFEQALAGRTDLLGRRGETLGPSHGGPL